MKYYFVQDISPCGLRADETLWAAIWKEDPEPPDWREWYPFNFSSFDKKK